MSFLGIKDIDVIILSYIEDEYFIYKLSLVNSYLKSLYEDNNLWLLKINQLYPSLKIIERIDDMRETYSYLKIYMKEGEYGFIINGIRSFLIYSIERNYLSMISWGFDYINFWKETHILCDFVKFLINNKNINLIDYIIETYGISEEKLIEQHKQCLYEQYNTYIFKNMPYEEYMEKYNVISYLSKNDKCILCHKNVESDNIYILEYVEKYGIINNLNTNIITKIYPDKRDIKTYYKRGKYHLVYWCELRGLI